MPCTDVFGAPSGKPDASAACERLRKARYRLNPVPREQRMRAKIVVLLRPDNGAEQININRVLLLALRRVLYDSMASISPIAR